MPPEKDDKKIGFLIQYPFHFFVFKNIAKKLQDLGEEVEFIIDPTGYFPVRPTEETLIKIREILSTSGFTYREFPFEDFLSPQKVSSFLDTYKVLVSTWYKGLISDTNSIKKIFVTYGAGKELTTFGFWKKEFDLCLAYGDYDYNFFKQLTQTVIVGNPKFDDWFNKIFDKELHSKIITQLDKNKKTVLYLPTHSDLCSIKDIHIELKNLTRDFNVIVKVHYYTPREQPELIEMLKHKDVMLFEDNADLITLLDFADVVLSDNSSAIFDAMLADKPLLVTDFLSEEYLNDGHQGARFYRRGRTGALTFSNSIEQRIKKEGIVCSIQNATDLKAGIEEALTDSKKEQRRLFTNTLFKYKDGLAGERAAKAIITLTNQKEAHPTPYLAFAITKLESSLKNNFYPQEINDNKFFCFIIFDSPQNDIGIVEQQLEELNFFSLRKKIAIVSFRENLLSTKKAEVYSGKDFVLMFSKVSEGVSDFIFLYPEVSFFSKTRPSNLIDKVQTQLSSITSPVSAGFVVDEGVRWFDISRQILATEKYQSFGIGSLFYKKFPTQTVINFWNSGIDDPRFFIIKKDHLFKTFETFKNKITNFYSLLLTARLLLLREGGQESMLYLPVFTKIYRRNFIKDKYKERALFEAWRGFPLRIILKRFGIFSILLFLQGVKGIIPFIGLVKLFLVSLGKYLSLRIYFYFHKKIRTLKAEDE